MHVTAMAEAIPVVEFAFPNQALRFDFPSFARDEGHYSVWKTPLSGIISSCSLLRTFPSSNCTPRPWIFPLNAEHTSQHSTAVSLGISRGAWVIFLDLSNLPSLEHYLTNTCFSVAGGLVFYFTETLANIMNFTIRYHMQSLRIKRFIEIHCQYCQGIELVPQSVKHTVEHHLCCLLRLWS